MIDKKYFNGDPSTYKRFVEAINAFPEANVWELNANIERHPYLVGNDVH